MQFMKLRINEPVAISLCVLVVLLAQAADTTVPTTGTWNLNRWMAGTGKVQLTLKRSTVTSTWVESSDYRVDDLKGLSRDDMSSLHSNVHFELQRDAGNLVCVGSIVAGVGGGRFSFSPNPSFITEMGKLGFDDINESRMFQMALMDINMVYVRQLIKLGLRDLNTRELIDLKSRNITTDYIAEVRGSGYDFSGADLIHLNDHGVEGGFLRELRKAG